MHSASFLRTPWPSFNLRTLWFGLFFLLAARVPPRATVYVFLAPDCPISQTCTLALRELHRQYGAQGIAFVGICPRADVSAADLARFGKAYQLAFPLKTDPGQRLTHQLNARVTPEVVVVAADGRTLYQGRIDDQYARVGQRRPAALHHELADALAAVVAGRPVAVAHTEPVGCLIR